jgi:hypothetical protein
LATNFARQRAAICDDVFARESPQCSNTLRCTDGAPARRQRARDLRRKRHEIAQLGSKLKKILEKFSTNYFQLLQ